MVGQTDELACVYAALILADDKVTITVSQLFFCNKSSTQIQLNVITFFLKGDKINAILKAAGYEVEPYWPGIYLFVYVLLD